MTDFAPKSISFLLIWIKPVPELRTSSMSITCLSLNSDGLNFQVENFIYVTDTFELSPIGFYLDGIVTVPDARPFGQQMAEI